MTNLYLPRINKFIKATIDLAGSKSIANRVLIIAALADSKSQIDNLPINSEDVMLMVDALKSLGVMIETSGTSCIVYGCSGKIPITKSMIYCGNSGTTLRFLTALLAIVGGDYYITGNARMCQRPIIDLVDCLQNLGSNINTNLGYPPIIVKKFIDNRLHKIEIKGDTSSQYLSGLLMALPILGRDIIVDIKGELISSPYVSITAQVMQDFGVAVKKIEDNQYYISSNSRYLSRNYFIEPDLSSASYFFAMAAINGDITVNNLNQRSKQGDLKFVEILGLMGAQIEYSPNAIRVIKASKLSAISIDMQDMPDVAMTLAVVALVANGKTTITGIRSWKIKETDRLQAMYNELTKLGALVVITNDSISILPPDKLNDNIAINTYEDHRMAMCFSLVALMGVNITINDFICVNKTFANYFDVFKNIAYYN